MGKGNHVQGYRWLLDSLATEEVRMFVLKLIPLHHDRLQLSSEVE